MYLLPRSLYACILATAAFTAAMSPTFDVSKFESKDIITRDVAVIGGGSPGTYSAISLKDKGKSVIVIEKKGRLGGHAETYLDPQTGTPVDLGVVIFHNITVVKNFFQRFDIPLNRADEFLGYSMYFDFRTGKQATQDFNPTPEQMTAAWDSYLEQYSKYPTLINGTILPSPVPEELYMPFGKFVEKYKLQAVVPAMYYYNPGAGDMLSNPVVEIFRYWSSNMVRSVQTGFLGPVNRNVSQVFSKAESELSSSSNLLLDSEVVQAQRGEGKAGVKLVVRTSSGPKLIIAKKLLIAIPPKVDFLAPFDLSTNEKQVFEKFINAGYSVGLIRNSGLPDRTAIANVVEDNTEFNLPVLPGAYSFAGSPILGLQMVTYGTPQAKHSLPFSSEDVASDVIGTVKRLQEQNPDLFPQTEPEVQALFDHSPYSLQVSAEEIKNGFYDELYALQGQRNTHYTGSAWKGEDSSLLWKYSEEIVIPRILEGL